MSSLAGEGVGSCSGLSGLGLRRLAERGGLGGRAEGTHTHTYTVMTDATQQYHRTDFNKKKLSV